MGKILDFHLTQYLGKFASVANEVIKNVREIWEQVIEIVPPLNCILNQLFAIPNQADQSTNCGFNRAIPEIWSLVQGKIMPAYSSICTIAAACD